jgi:hypothetical protein
MADADNTETVTRAKGERFYHEPQLYVIWSEEHGAWWRGGGWGYTRSLIDAGLFSEADARKIAENANRYSETVKEVALPDPLAGRKP